MRLINRQELKELPTGTLFSNSPHTELCRTINATQYVKHKPAVRDVNFAKPPIVFTIKTYGCTTKDTVAVYEPEDYEGLITGHTRFVLAGIKVSPFEDVIESSIEKPTKMVSMTDFAKMLDISLATLKKMEERDSNFPAAFQFTPTTIRYRESDIAKYIRSLRVSK